MSNRQSPLERFKRLAHSDYWIDYELQHGATAECGLRPAFLYGQSLAKQDFSFKVAAALYQTSTYYGDDVGFAEGYYGSPAALHFVGMQDSRQYSNAVRLFGAPDYDWPVASFRILGECAPHDTVIFGASAFVRPKKHRKHLAAT